MSDHVANVIESFDSESPLIVAVEDERILGARGTGRRRDLNDAEPATARPKGPLVKAESTHAATEGGNECGPGGAHSAAAPHKLVQPPRCGASHTSL